MVGLPARIVLRPHADGGRRTPPGRVYSPLISFGDEPSPRPASVVVRFDEDVVLGEPVTATLSPMVQGVIDAELRPGRTFTLWEGRRPVAHGVLREPAVDRLRRALSAWRLEPLPMPAEEAASLASRMPIERTFRAA